MKVGEYQGQDGCTYRWDKPEGVDGYSHEGEIGFEWMDMPVRPADWPAAKLALDALIASEEGEWVEWTVNGMRYRARGDEIQWWYELTSHWRSEGDTSLGYAYNKGRSVALEEVQELVEAMTVRRCERPHTSLPGGGRC